MLLEKMRTQEDFTDTDTAIADYILHSDRMNYTLTSTQLAKACNVSQSAVHRFCRKLGCSGYRAFVLELSRESIEEMRRTVLDLERPFHGVMRVPEAKHAVARIYENTLARADQVLNDMSLQRLVQRLCHARSIDLYGYGISGIHARQLAFDLQSLGLPCRFSEGENSRYLKNSDLSDTVSVLFAYTGTNASLVHTAQTIRSHNGWCFAIVGRTGSPLSAACSESVSFAPEYYEVLDNMSFEIGAGYVCHLIISLLAGQAAGVEKDNG